MTVTMCEDVLASALYMWASVQGPSSIATGCGGVALLFLRLSLVPHACCCACRVQVLIREEMNRPFVTGPSRSEVRLILLMQSIPVRSAISISCVHPVPFTAAVEMDRKPWLKCPLSGETDHKKLLRIRLIPELADDADETKVCSSRNSLDAILTTQ